MGHDTLTSTKGYINTIQQEPGISVLEIILVT